MDVESLRKKIEELKVLELDEEEFEETREAQMENGNFSDTFNKGVRIGRAFGNNIALDKVLALLA